MLITRTRIKNPEPYLHGLTSGTELYVGIRNVEDHRSKLVRAGFTDKLEVGERVLPAIFGRVTKLNAEGNDRIRRDLDKERVYRPRHHQWEDWHGGSHSGIIFFPYWRFPREPILPPGLELTVTRDAEGNKIVVSDMLRFEPSQYDRIALSINICLEIFGECEILTRELVPVAKTPVKELNWRLLPKGKYPWERLKGEVAPIIEKAKPSQRPVLAGRLKIITEAEPDFVAIGEGGFSGYLVFGFPKKKLYILESLYYGNATYVLDEDWETLSKMSKGEIIGNALQKERIVHLAGWDIEIRRVLNS